MKRLPDIALGFLLALLFTASMNLDYWLAKVDKALTPDPPALEGRTFGVVQCWRMNGGPWECGCTLRGQETRE